MSTSENTPKMKKEQLFVEIDNATVDHLLADKSITLGEIKVYLTIERFAYEKKAESFPTQTEIAERTGLSRQTVNSAIKALEKKGYIEIKKHKKPIGFENNVYEIKQFEDLYDENNKPIDKSKKVCKKAEKEPIINVNENKNEEQEKEFSGWVLTDEQKRELSGEPIEEEQKQEFENEPIEVKLTSEAPKTIKDEYTDEELMALEPKLIRTVKAHLEELHISAIMSDDKKDQEKDEVLMRQIKLLMARTIENEQ